MALGTAGDSIVIKYKALSVNILDLILVLILLELTLNQCIHSNGMT